MKEREKQSDAFRMNKAIVSMFIKTATERAVREKLIRNECNLGIPLKTILMMCILNTDFTDEDIIKMVRYWAVCAHSREEDKVCMSYFIE